MRAGHDLVSLIGMDNVQEGTCCGCDSRDIMRASGPVHKWPEGPKQT